MPEDLTCSWCGTRYVVASLARFCEDKHNDELDEYADDEVHG